MSHEHLIITLAIAGIAFIVIGFAHIFRDQDKRWAKREANEKETLDAILGVELIIKCKDGRIERRILNQENAHLWWRRWVFGYRYVDHTKIKYGVYAYKPEDKP